MKQNMLLKVVSITLSVSHSECWLLTANCCWNLKESKAFDAFLQKLQGLTMRCFTSDETSLPWQGRGGKGLGSTKP
jgi:hypothetical protein